MFILYGLGTSNQAVKRYFDKMNIAYLVYVDNTNDDLIPILNSFDIIIKSAGIKNSTKFMKKIIDNNNIVITDIELLTYFNQLSRKNYITITGSNGKTTVTSLVSKLLEDKNFKACGNIGDPVFNYVDCDNLVIETSSYMLEHINKIHPHVHVVLNLFKHHLNHHGSYNNYIKSKLKIISNMTKDDILVYNYDDIILRNIVKLFNVKKLSFSLINNQCDCYYYDNTIIYKNFIIDVNKLNLIGTHNYQNIMASILTTSVYKEIENNTIDEIYNFKPLSHRLEKIFINKYPSTIFINDSKSTNPYSVISAINSLKENGSIILLLGGAIDNVQYEIFNNHLIKKCQLILFGENRYLLDEVLPNNYLYKTLKEALNFLFTLDLNNKIVLFSPGAPSFDEFKSFEERGNMYKAYLNNIVI